MKQLKVAALAIVGLVLVPLAASPLAGAPRSTATSVRADGAPAQGIRDGDAAAARQGSELRLAQAGGAGNRVALVIGNATYPDDNKPLAQPIKDARAFADELKRAGFDVTTGEDLSKQKLRAAIDAFKTKIKPGSAALFFFSGYGIQTGKQSYVIPVDAQIWTEGEVRRDGTSIESILADMNAAGATVKLVIIDAARRNPFERRFRGYSGGLASLAAPAGTLAIYAAAADKVANESEGENSLFVGELLKEMRSPNLSAEAILKNTREGVSRASKNEQVPSVSSSLVEDFYFGRPPVNVAIAPNTGVQEVRPPPPPPPPPPVPPVTTEKKPDPPPPPPPPPVKPPPQRDAAIQRLDDALDRNPRDADLYYKRGQAWAQRSQYALASEDFSEAIRLNPNDAESYNNRCFVRAVLDQLQAALADCNEALRLRQSYADAYDSRGLVNLKLGQLDRAISDFDAALRGNPKLVSSLYGRGKAKLKKGDSAGGNADIRSARTMNPKIEDEFSGYGVP